MTIRSDVITNEAGIGPASLTGQDTAKAWAKYNGSTNTLEGQFGISSLTDDSAGNHTIALSVAMADAHFCQVMGSDADRISLQNVATASEVSLDTRNASGTSADYADNSVGVIGSIG